MQKYHDEPRQYKGYLKSALNLLDPPLPESLMCHGRPGRDASTIPAFVSVSARAPGGQLTHALLIGMGYDLPKGTGLARKRPSVVVASRFSFVSRARDTSPLPPGRSVDDSARGSDQSCWR